MTDPVFKADRIKAEWRGEEITIWNRLTVIQQHALGYGLHETEHQVLAGDGSTGERPDYISPQMRDKLRDVDVYPNAKVIDPADDEVNVV
jgi:hypothetical protein